MDFQDGMQGAKRSWADGPARLCNAADRLKGHLAGPGESVNRFLDQQENGQCCIRLSTVG
jgi:hypothetical protein